MKRRPSILPASNDISDEAAAVLTEFLFQLATECDRRYLTKLLRHADARRALEMETLDPERPWCRKPLA